MSSNRATRAARVKDGLCSVCLRRRARVGHATCRPCGDAIQTYSTTLYTTRRAAGTCTVSSCSEPATGDLCETHAEARRVRRRVG